MNDDWSDSVGSDVNAEGDDVAGAAPAVDSPGGDGLPGVPVEGYPGLRAGAFGSGDGLLGVTKVSNPQGSTAAQIPPGYTAVGDGSKYMQDGSGAYHFTPAYGAKIRNGQTDWGNVDWKGVALDLGSIAAGAVPLVGGTAVDVLKAIPGMGMDTWRELHHDFQPRKNGQES